MPIDDANLDEASLAMIMTDMGYPVRTLNELRGVGREYKGVVPLLISWARRVKDPVFLEQIVRTLSVPWAKPTATEIMTELFVSAEDESNSGLRWAIGNAIDVLYDDSIYDKVAKLVKDPTYGVARQMAVLGLGRSKRKDASQLLMSLLGDSEVNGHAVQALAKLRDPASKAALESMRHDSRAWVRKAAAKGLSRIG